MATINKRDLSARVAQAASSAPSIADRVSLAQRHAAQHPVAEVPLHGTLPGLAVTGPQTELKSGRFETVAITLIDPNPFNARQIYRAERVSELARSIQAHGQDVPGIATIRNERYVLAAGHYRLKAIKTTGITTMNVMVHDNLSDKELYEYSYRENREREPESALDDALCWRDLLTQKVYSSDVELAEAIGQSKSNVSKTLSILNLPEVALDEIRKDPTAYGLSALYELGLFAKVSTDESAVLSFIDLLREGEIGRKEIQEARARLQDPKSRKHKETSRPYTIAKEGSYSGSLKVFPDSGRVMLDVVFKNQTDREEILAVIKAKLGVTE